MCTTAMKAAKACHAYVTTFLASNESSSLFSEYPNHFPPQFSSTLHALTKAQLLKTFNDLLYILECWDLPQLSISYNGGKDCLVQLIIYLAAVYQHNVIDKKDLNPICIKAVYVHTEKEFDELINFLHKSISQFGLDFTAVYTYSNKQHIPQSPNIKNLFSEASTLQSGFYSYLNYDKYVKAIVVGIRHTDPYGSDLTLQQKTDTNKGWPKFMRVNPVLDWHTGQIWYFIKWLELFSKNTDFKITYCKLYDEGYTSIGGCDSTVRNPQLRKSNSNEFWPAWWVIEDDIERLSRVQKGKV